ncbi:MAG: glutamine amidotransferase [Kiritimatiellae bacterium]|nr:glutamine amidotransferase [Kiritimatiellia bacterium]
MKTIKRGFFLLVASLFFIPLLQAASVKVASGSDGKERVIMENSLLRLQIDPNRGARVDDLRFKPWGAIEAMKDRNKHCLLADHFWQENWPGQFWEAKYDYKILSEGPAEAAVKFSCLSQDKGIPQVAGLLLEKTITLKENNPAVNVAVTLTNTTSAGKYFGYWAQNICWLGGDKADDQYFMPSKRGIVRSSSDDANPPDGGFVRDPQAGWSAAIDGKTQTGLVFFMDYNDLWFLYDCAPSSTIEWQYGAVAIPAGKSWKTEISILPVSKLPSVSYASRRLLMGAAFNENKQAGRLEVTQTYSASTEPLKSLAVQTGMELLLSHRQTNAAQAQSIAGLDAGPQTFTVSLPYDTVTREPAVIRLTFTGETVKGEAFSETGELFYRGARVSNDDPNSQVGAPFYTIKSPNKIKTTIKPDRIVRIVKARPQVLFLKGLFYSSYRLEPALGKVSPAAEIKNGYVCNAGVFGWSLDFFPYDYDVLMSYDLVILGDVNAASLGETALEMLKDYCRQGGNLLVLAGPLAYGGGGYGATVLDEILPVLIQKPFDLRAVEKGAKVSVAPGALPAEAAALRPEYIHQVKTKPDAQALMTCGAAPMIVLGQYGSGTVCCVTAPPLGESIFCDQPQWQGVLEYVLKKLGLNR